MALLAAALAAMPLPSLASRPAASNCGPLENHYGPFDYRTRRDMLQRVEQFHFTPAMEGLIRGNNTSQWLGANLAYLMHTSPNHHRGLVAMTRLVDREKTPQPAGFRHSIDCYYERALRFAPTDTVVRVLYARFLNTRGQREEALAQLDAAVELSKEDGFSHYNVGLMYAELKRYDRALAQAHRAKALGFEKPGLRALLEAAGEWREPAN
jgi:tetratricopeptide (TPR) repeat protein